MKITKKWLKKHKACCSETDMNRAEKELNGDIALICDALLKENRFDDASWLITQNMNKKQCIEYAIFAAKQVIDIFEKEYPKDKRPRLAIEAAEKYLKNPCKKTKDAAACTADAADAADAAASAAANAAAYAAYEAAYTAYEAAYTAYTAADATRAVLHAADAAISTADAAMRAKIIKNGLKILKAR